MDAIFVDGRRFDLDLAAEADPSQLLLAVRDEAGDLVGTMQLTLIPGLSRGGAKRLQIEAVRLAVYEQLGYQASHGGFKHSL